MFENGGGSCFFSTISRFFKILKIRKIVEENMTPPHFGNFKDKFGNQGGKIIYSFFALQVTVPAVLGFIGIWLLIIGYIYMYMYK